MTTVDRHTRLATEQQLIREATQRLLAGTPQRSNGSLTISTLATEAGLPRHRIYEHHADLVAEFKAKTHTGAPLAPDVHVLRRQLDDAHERIQQLEATQTQLTAKITTLCAVITELTHQTYADNIVALPSRSRHEP
jgi:chromosome segregation ATPase